MALIATCLATPHAFVYDLPLLTGALALLVGQKLDEHQAFTLFDTVVLVLALVFPAIMTGATQHLPVGGPVLVMVLAMAVRNHLIHPRLSNELPHEAVAVPGHEIARHGESALIEA